MRRPNNVEVYQVVLEKDGLETETVFLSPNFALLAEDLSGWEKENYRVKAIQSLGAPIVLEPLKVLQAPEKGYN